MNMAQRSFSPDMNRQAPQELPSAFEAEQALLGGVLVNQAAMDVIPANLEEHHFEEPLHGAIYREMKRLRADGKGINPVAIKMAVSNAPAQIGGLTFSQYLVELAGAAVTIINVPDFAAAILDASQRRELIGLAQKLQAIAFEHELEIPDDIKAIEDRLAEVRSERAGKEASAAGDSYIAMFQSSMSRSGNIGVPICLPEIAKVLSEPVYEAGNLYGLLSSSGEGKTSLVMQIIYHAVLKGHPVLFLSYDQNAGQCVRQMICQVNGTEVRRQNEPDKWLKKEEQDACLDFAMWLNKQPLDIIRCQREGVAQLVSYSRRFVKKRANGKTPLIVIDHIKKIKVRDPRSDAGTQSGEITVELKALADETQSAVILLNQRNSAGVKRDNPRPIDEDLHGGEGARQDYDSVMYLYRPQKYRAKRVATAASDRDWKIINKVFGEFGDEDEIKTVAEIGVIKNRFGDPDVREILKFEAKYTRYVSKHSRDQEGLFG